MAPLLPPPPPPPAAAALAAAACSALAEGWQQLDSVLSLVKHAAKLGRSRSASKGGFSGWRPDNTILHNDHSAMPQLASRQRLRGAGAPMQTRAGVLTKPRSPYRCYFALARCRANMSTRARGSWVSTAADPPAVEPSSSPPASPSAVADAGTESASLQGAAGPAAHGTAPASPSAPSSSGAGGGGGSQWAAPHRAASDAGSVDSHVDSHHSWGTHVSHHSQRSRWSIAATVGTTAAPRLAEPRLLEEGGSSDEGSRAASPAASNWRRSDTGGSGGAAAAAASPRASRRSPRSSGRGIGEAGAASSGSRRLPAIDHPLETAGSSSSGAAAAPGGLQTAESAAAAGKLPPRLVRLGWC